MLVRLWYSDVVRLGGSQLLRMKYSEIVNPWKYSTQIGICLKSSFTVVDCSRSTFLWRLGSPSLSTM